MAMKQEQKDKVQLSPEDLAEYHRLKMEKKLSSVANTRTDPERPSLSSSPKEKEKKVADYI